MKLKNLLYNSWVLYFIVFVVFFNIVGHALNGNYMIIIFFILISFITSFFSKNMIIILILGISIANILFYGPKPMSVEGFNSKKENNAAEPSPFEEEDLDEKNILDLKNFKLDLSGNNEEKLKQKMEEIKEVKDKINTMQKNLPKDLDKTSLKEDEINFLNDKFKEFLKIQESVLNNIGSLEQSIQSVDKVVKDIRANVDKMPKSK